jgi:prepilin-type N-terminal cleavage/methylation domain-containing protein
MKNPETSKRRTFPRPPFRRAGFTLIELLTVIAIIGILAAILIPVVGNVRKSAKAANCVSRLRTIGTAAVLYAADNRDFLPTNTKNNAQGVQRGRMYYLLTKYVVPQSAGKNGSNVRELIFFRCTNLDDDTDNAALLYDYNWMVANRNASETGTTEDRPNPLRLGRVKSPDRTPFAWDVRGNSAPSTLTGATNPFRMFPQHGKNCNVAFLTGRVAPADLSNIKNFPFYGSIPSGIWAPNTVFDPLYDGK